MGDVTPFLIVFFGAGIGGTLRHGVNTMAMLLFGPGFPFGTLTVNIVGCLAMGLLAGWLAFKGEASQPWRLFLMTGVLGGFTTFSAFSLDLVLLWERGLAGCAVIYAGASVLLSLTAVIAGLWLMRSFTS